MDEVKGADAPNPRASRSSRKIGADRRRGFRTFDTSRSVNPASASDLPNFYRAIQALSANPVINETAVVVA